MALTTTYDTLQTWCIQVLNRDDDTDLTGGDIENLIQDAEASLRRDDRARLLTDLSPFTTTADTEEDALPSDFDSIFSLAHEGPTYFGEIEIVALDQVQEFKIGTTGGVPRAAAIIPGADGAKLRWGPTPNDAFALRLAYWSKITSLSDSNTSNRFLSAHPDIYRYAVLVESAPYLKEDERIAVWQSQLDQRLERLALATQRELFSGTLTRRPSQSL